MNTAAVEQKVSDQFRLFEAELPALMLTHACEWVVYLDGPKHFCSSEPAALAWAYKNLDYYAGFVIAEVAEQKIYSVPTIFTTRSTEGR